MIQGSMSLYKEMENNCMMVLLGMHRYIQTWDQMITARGRPTGMLVHQIRNDMFTTDDEKRLDIQRTPQPYQRRCASSRHTAGMISPVNLLYDTLVVLRPVNNLETLKATEGGTWSNLSAAY
jgi:hypothetical protein